jgi:hypothetical protein
MRSEWSDLRALFLFYFILFRFILFYFHFAPGGGASGSSQPWSEVHDLQPASPKHSQQATDDAG